MLSNAAIYFFISLTAILFSRNCDANKQKHLVANRLKSVWFITNDTLNDVPAIRLNLYKTAKNDLMVPTDSNVIHKKTNRKSRKHLQKDIPVYEYLSRRQKLRFLAPLIDMFVRGNAVEKPYYKMKGTLIVKDTTNPQTNRRHLIAIQFLRSKRPKHLIESILDLDSRKSLNSKKKVANNLHSTWLDPAIYNQNANPVSLRFETKKEISEKSLLNKRSKSFVKSPFNNTLLLAVRRESNRNPPFRENKKGPNERIKSYWFLRNPRAPQNLVRSLFENRPVTTPPTINLKNELHSTWFKNRIILESEDSDEYNESRDANSNYSELLVRYKPVAVQFIFSDGQVINVDLKKQNQFFDENEDASDETTEDVHLRRLKVPPLPRNTIKEIYLLHGNHSSSKIHRRMEASSDESGLYAQNTNGKDTESNEIAERIRKIWLAYPKRQKQANTRINVEELGQEDEGGNNMEEKEPCLCNCQGKPCKNLPNFPWLSDESIVYLRSKNARRMEENVDSDNDVLRGANKLKNLRSTWLSKSLPAAYGTRLKQLASSSKKDSKAASPEISDRLASIWFVHNTTKINKASRRFGLDNYQDNQQSKGRYREAPYENNENQTRLDKKSASRRWKWNMRAVRPNSKKATPITRNHNATSKRKHSLRTRIFNNAYEIPHNRNQKENSLRSVWFRRLFNDSYQNRGKPQNKAWKWLAPSTNLYIASSKNKRSLQLARRPNATTRFNWGFSARPKKNPRPLVRIDNTSSSTEDDKSYRFFQKDIYGRHSKPEFSRLGRCLVARPFRHTDSLLWERCPSKDTNSSIVEARVSDNEYDPLGAPKRLASIWFAYGNNNTNVATRRNNDEKQEDEVKRFARITPNKPEIHEIKKRMALNDDYESEVSDNTSGRARSKVLISSHNFRTTPARTRYKNSKKESTNRFRGIFDVRPSKKPLLLVRSANITNQKNVPSYRSFSDWRLQKRKKKRRPTSNRVRGAWFRSQFDFNDNRDNENIVRSLPKMVIVYEPRLIEILPDRMDKQLNSNEQISRNSSSRKRKVQQAFSPTARKFSQKDYDFLINLLIDSLLKRKLVSDSGKRNFARAIRKLKKSHVIAVENILR
ncbi:hypothetical protein ILUMI_03863 [Ignelater luminosus]|uniref:Protein TIC 214 n=1 Tax=Ignelater luminosus TaxID=2038154 RepID=A0A8K0GF39_IGNLU|nr:hypothetical protein ILUMI_03863 [Ignelater luminosus]